MQFTKNEAMSRELAASSSLVAIKLSNIKAGFEAPGMLNYNLDIICAVQLRSSVKCISLFAQKKVERRVTNK